MSGVMDDSELEVKAKLGPGSADNGSLGRQEHYWFYWHLERSGANRSWWWEEQKGSVLASERRCGGG